MSEELVRLGNVQLSVSASECDACEKVGALRAQLTGPHGYVNLCHDCALIFAAHLRIRQAKQAIRAIRRAAEGEDS